MEQKIIPCNHCKGFGKLLRSEITNHHKNERDEWEEECNWCEGTGRLIQETITRPLTKDELKIQKR